MTTFTKPLLIADNVAGAKPSSPSVACEILSTKGAFLVSRMTSAQVAALTLENGMIVYNTDDDEFNLAQGGTWSNFSPNATQTETVSITSPQLLGMFNAPVNILPAPGAGKAIIVTNVIFDYVFNTTAYQAGGTIQLFYGAKTATASSALPAAALTAGAGTVTTGASVTTQRNAADVANAAITLSNNTAAFTTGDGTAKVTVFYTLITL